MKRADLAGKLELIGRMFEIDGMTDILLKFDDKTTSVKFNALVIQMESLIMQKSTAVADQLIMMHTGKEQEEVDKMQDAEYANALKDTIITDVIGFFASSPHTDGKK